MESSTTFVVIDFIFIFIIFVCAVRGALCGFLEEFFSKLAIICGVLLGFLMNKQVVPHLPSIQAAPFLTTILAFIIIFVVVYIAVRLVQKVVGIAFQGDIMKGLNRCLGFFLGIGEGFLIVALVLFLLHSQQFFEVNAILSGSYFDIILSPLFMKIPETIIPGTANV